MGKKILVTVACWGIALSVITLTTKINKDKKAIKKQYVGVPLEKKN